jgi:enamine deaminase RidA (YjgF/YER057c/UK114 family)
MPRYTNVVVANGFAFIAGQTAFDAQSNVVGVGDFRAQAEQTYRNLKVGLAREELLVEVDAIVALPTP